MARIKRDAVRKLGLFPALGFIAAAVALLIGVAMQNAPAVYAGALQLSDQMGLDVGGGSGEGEGNLIGSGVELHEAGGQSGRWHNSHAVGTAKTYTIVLDNDPNIANPATTGDAVKVVISVDDVTIDGVAYNGTDTTISSPATAKKLVEICHGTCAHASSDWGTSKTLYFASAAKTIGSNPGVDVYKWDVAQTIKVRPIDDDFDDLTDKRTRIKHAFTNYSSLVDQFLIVQVNDDDDRGITLSATGITGDESGWAQAVTEDASNPKYIELDVSLASRPQIGGVKLTATGAQDSKDPGNDLSWILKPSGTACASVSTGWKTGTDSTVTLTYNTGSNEWNTAQKLCIRLDKDSVIHTQNEVVSLTFAASNNDATKKTDYDTGFVPSGTSPGSSWTPVWTRSATVPASAESVTYTITITNGDTASITFGHEGSDLPDNGRQITLDE